MDAAQGIADAHGFELLLVEEPTQLVFAVEHGAICTWSVGGSREEVSTHGRRFHVDGREEGAS
eukprot:8652875-Heterocapsa_arctica.AAC.1